MAAGEGWATIVRKDAAPPAPVPGLAPEARSAEGVRWVVVDTNAFIHGINISGLNFELCTVEEVVREVRDSSSRAMLNALPVGLSILEPAPESLEKVSEFARATGDIRSLSAIDLKLLALTHTLDVRAHGGDSHLRSRPPPLLQRTLKRSEQPELPGWGSNVPNPEEWDEISEENDGEDRTGSHILGIKNLTLSDLQMQSHERIQEGDIMQECGDGGSDEEREENGGAVVLSQEEARLHKTQQREGVGVENLVEGNGNLEGEAEEIADEKEANDRGEIDGVATVLCQEETTLPKMQEQEGGSADKLQNLVESQDEGKLEAGTAASVTDGSESDESWGLLSTSSISCMTTDFAMQNVILQMGLRLLSPNGIQVRELKRWVLRCHACNTVTREMTRVFCPKCGNGGTLFRASVTVGANGTVIGASKRRINIRGTKYSLPQPKGGREGAAENPILREDQLPCRLLHPKKSSKVPSAELDAITSFDDVFQAKSKKALVDSASMRNLASQFSGRRNPNDSHFSKQRRR